MKGTSKIIVLICALGITLQGRTQEVRYSLMDCIERALDENFSVRIARNQLETVQNNVSLSPFLPSLSLSARQTQTVNHSYQEYSDQNSAHVDSRTDDYRIGPNFSWRLFDGFAMFSSYAKQKELLASGELNFRLSVENMVMELSNQYYQIITLHNQVDLVQQLVDISRLRYEQALLKYDLGAISGLECQQAKIYFNADSSSLLVQKQSLSNAYVKLCRIMGVSYDLRISIQDTIVPETRLTLDRLQASMLQKNTELLLMKQGQTVSEYDLKLARASRYPVLDFSSGYTLSAVNTPLSTSLRYNETNGFNWGFSLSIPLFNGYTINRQIKNARLGVARADLQYGQLENNLVSSLIQEYNVYVNNVQMIDFESQNAEVAYSNVDAAMEKYRLGSLSGIEFRDIQLNYLNAVDRKLRAIYQAKLSEVALLVLAGELF
ncbi:MAG: TolC family protein [Bacteroidetes bacterium]|nr:TolC family protein [Bacteroidota bacterium]